MEDMMLATFAGGCFWCMVPPFEKLEGVIGAKAGYIGGQVKNPTYEEVCTGKTGHFEAVQIKYDPSVVSYEKLLEFFWKNIDPTDPVGQFADEGKQYRTAIFYHNDEQKALAQKSKEELEKSKKFRLPIATMIIEAAQFYEAEEYHQDYHKKESARYKAYKKGSGREDYILNIWGDENL